MSSMAQKLPWWPLFCLYLYFSQDSGKPVKVRYSPRYCKHVGQRKPLRNWEGFDLKGVSQETYLELTSEGSGLSI